ncbi:hypothetical protein, partial [Desulfitobacterium sp.]|uniref:hypothetical protein n=1 Tax=Desulfitobacterium sp. TaxID=49981 RepID=UPI002B9254E7
LLPSLCLAQAKFSLSYDECYAIRQDKATKASAFAMLGTSQVFFILTMQVMVLFMCMLCKSLVHTNEEFL